MVEFQIRRRAPEALAIHRAKPHLKLIVLILFVCTMLISATVYRYSSADLTVHALNAFTLPALPEKKLLAWPSYGQAAVGTAELGVLETHGDMTPRPTASTAKLITMLAVMEKKPFALGGSGETFTLTQADVDSFDNYVARNGSNVPVEVGEKITQYQAMQGVLLASSNNLADTLAIRTFGSLSSYKDYATKMLGRYGLKNTVIGADASGLDPGTRSTAADLTVIASKVLAQPVIASITSTATASLPVAGTIHNTNILLGSDGVIGLKTGFTDEAGGVFVLAANHEIDGHRQQIISVVMGAQIGRQAQLASYDLFLSARNNFIYKTLIAKGQVVGLYTPEWTRDTYDAVATEDIGSFIWAGTSIDVKTNFRELQPSHDADDSGKVAITLGSRTLESTVKLAKPIDSPSPLWRIAGRSL